MSSASSTELAVAGFRLGRELGRGERSIVYEAHQPNLGRRVALKLLPAGEEVRPLDWPEHPRAVSLYATGSWADGRFVAMQLVRGRSLAELVEAGERDPARLLGWLADAASALDAAHRSGIAHGSVAARNVLVDRDGRALLSDFGLGETEPSIEADRADFAALLRACLGEALPHLPDSSAGVLVALAAEAVRPEKPARGRRWRLPALVVAGVLAAGATGLALIERGEADPVPTPQGGALPLGSELASGDVSSVDCTGAAPSGGSQACTVVQTGLPGQPLRPPAPGAIRSWAVRGARGELALQVIRRRDGAYIPVARSRYQLVPDEGVHVLEANLAVEAGDLIGVQLAPGAAIGVRRDVPGATTARWLGQLFIDPRPVELAEGSGFDHEMLVRADYVRDAEPRQPGALAGRAARRAPAGEELRARVVEVEGAVRRVAVVRLAGTVAVDLFAGRRRLARLPAPDADPAGRLLNFTALEAGSPVLRWRNPDGRDVSHEYAVEPRTLSARG